MATSSVSLSLVLSWVSRHLPVDYFFTLREVALNRTDILAAQVRDVEMKLSKVAAVGPVAVQGEMEQLKKEIRTLTQIVDEIAKRPVFAQAKGSLCRLSHEIGWSYHSEEYQPVCFQSDGSVRFESAGVYAITVFVYHKDNAVVSLEQGGKQLASSQGGDLNKYGTTALQYVFTTASPTSLHVCFDGEFRDQDASITSDEIAVVSNKYISI